MLKLAISADGKAGLAGRRPVAITGEPARDRVHLMRATSDAILVGIGTVLADDPALTCRLPGMLARSPVQIVLDSRLRLPPDSRLVRSARDVPVWAIAAAGAPADRARELEEKGVMILHCDADPEGLAPAGALALIAARGVTRLMVEGGPTIAGALVRADLVDEAALLPPTVIGPDGIDPLAGSDLSVLTTSPKFAPRGIEAVGADRLETFDRI